jgi:hypothetical protein
MVPGLVICHPLRPCASARVIFLSGSTAARCLVWRQPAGLAGTEAGNAKADPGGSRTGSDIR